MIRQGVFQNHQEECMLKIIIKVLAVLLMVAGLVWALQGLNILPGTFMRGDPQWVINGAVIVVFGAGLFWFSNRK
jgi:G:T-mismatch repair DNA endonuclease (very short patch repair protein)